MAKAPQERPNHGESKDGVRLLFLRSRNRGMATGVLPREFAGYESCTKPISTNPGSMEAGEYGLTRGTCFVARRLEVVAVAGLLWTSWCVLSGADFFLCECFRFFSSSNAHGLLQV